MSLLFSNIGVGLNVTLTERLKAGSLSFLEPSSVFSHATNAADCQLPLRALLSTSHAAIWDKHFK